MTRSHRIAHRTMWSVLTLLVALGFVMALVLRPPPDPPAAPDAKTAEQPPAEPPSAEPKR